MRHNHTKMKLLFLYHPNRIFNIGVGIYENLTVWSASLIFLNILINLPTADQNFALSVDFGIPFLFTITIAIGNFSQESVDEIMNAKTETP